MPGDSLLPISSMLRFGSSHFVQPVYVQSSAGEAVEIAHIQGRTRQEVHAQLVAKIMEFYSALTHCEQEVRRCMSQQRSASLQLTEKNTRIQLLEDFFLREVSANQRLKERCSAQNTLLSELNERLGRNTETYNRETPEERGTHWLLEQTFQGEIVALEERLRFERDANISSSERMSLKLEVLKEKITRLEEALKKAQAAPDLTEELKRAESRAKSADQELKERKSKLDEAEARIKALEQELLILRGDDRRGELFHGVESSTAEAFFAERSDSLAGLGLYSWLAQGEGDNASGSASWLDSRVSEGRQTDDGISTASSFSSVGSGMSSSLGESSGSESFPSKNFPGFVFEISTLVKFPGEEREMICRLKKEGEGDLAFNLEGGGPAEIIAGLFDKFFKAKAAEKRQEEIINGLSKKIDELELGARSGGRKRRRVEVERRELPDSSGVSFSSAAFFGGIPPLIGMNPEVGLSSNTTRLHFSE
jgi:hypothetical protein